MLYIYFFIFQELDKLPDMLTTTITYILTDLPETQIATFVNQEKKKQCETMLMIYRVISVSIKMSVRLI